MATLDTYTYATTVADGDQLNDGYFNDVNRALVPVSGIVAWAKSLAGTPSLPTHFVECNGQVLSDASSPLNGVTIPNLNASGGGTQRFLRGSTTSGTTGGSDAHVHVNNDSATLANMQANGGGTTLAQNSNTSSTSTLPSYYEIVWIMRIK
jgi:hypothetical protein